jgi:hypothetical protein
MESEHEVWHWQCEESRSGSLKAYARELVRNRLD